MALGTWAQPSNTNSVSGPELLTAEEKKVLAAFRKEKSDTKRMALLEPMTRDHVMDLSSSIRAKLRLGSETLAKAARRLKIV